MARVKDTGPQAGPSTMPAAGRTPDKSSVATNGDKATEKKATKRTSNTSSDLKPMNAPSKKAPKAKKSTEVEIKPNEDGHPIGVETAKAGDETTKSAKGSKRNSKIEAELSTANVDSGKTTKSKKTKPVDTKPIESTVKKASKEAKDATAVVAKEIKAKASKAKKDLEATPTKQGKRKATTTDSNPEIQVSKKAKKDASQKQPTKQSENSSGEKAPKKTGSKTNRASEDSEDQKTEAKGKKRKNLDAEDDTIKVDASPEAKSAKKQKKGDKQGGSQVLDAVKSTLGNVADAVTGGQTSIVEDVANFAEDALKSKPKGKAASSKGKKTAKSAVEPAEDEAVREEATANDDEVGEVDQDEWEPEDEIAQLITGFESESEEIDSGDEGFKQGQNIPALPKQKALSAKERKSKTSDGPGVIYIGRVPHGFHEHEMRAYFSQFGDVNHVRLSRSKKTGRSKHYAFLEFKSEEVAKIAAKTMDKYLLFGHILRCSFIPQERIHPSLWKGADKRFKSVPWAKIEGRKLEAPKGRSHWQKKVEKESRKRATKAEKLKELGYNFEPTALTDVESIPAQVPKQSEEEVIEEEKTIVVGKEGNTLTISEEVKTTKTKKTKKAAKTKEALPEVRDVQSSPEDGKRVKKPSKRALEASETAPDIKKAKKSRKSQ